MSAKDDSTKNDTKTVQVTVVILYNGTYVVDSKADPSLQIVEIVLLVFVFLISFGTNIFLLVTITSSYTLRRVPFNMLLANLSVVFLVESLLNMSVALLFVSTDVWHLGYIGCDINSFFGQLVTLEVTFSLAIMCAEGMASVWQPFRFQSYLTVKKQVIAIVTMWISGILLCTPLLLKSITSRLFASRYSCASAGQDGFVHSLFITIWCYCLLIIFGAGCLLNLGIRQCQEYRLRKRKNDVNYSDIFIQGDLWTEWVNFKLVSWLSLFYLCLELPYIVVHQISALKIYPEDKDTTNNTVVLPLIEVTPKYETAFIWFRYIYSCLFACVTFRMRKDIRHKFKALLQCCRNNVIRDHSATPIIRQDIKKPTKKHSLVPLSLNTPVLYISPDGLCLRQLDTVSKVINKFAKNNTSSHPKFISYLCDLDNTIVEDFTSDSTSDVSISERSYSKESEVSLPDMGSGSFNNRLSEEIPMKDMSTLIFEPEPVLEPEPIREPEPVLKPDRHKKSVRFAETLTIYRTLTPRQRTPTPEWVVNSRNKSLRTRNGKVSRIPKMIRKVDNITPWKVELNTTYRVNTPTIDPKTIKAISSDTKLNIASGQQMAKAKKKSYLQNKTRKVRKMSSPPRWKISRLY